MFGANEFLRLKIVLRSWPNPTINFDREGGEIRKFSVSVLGGVEGDDVPAHYVHSIFTGITDAR